MPVRLSALPHLFTVAFSHVPAYLHPCVDSNCVSDVGAGIFGQHVGFARAMSNNTLVLTTIRGTPLYMAPELIRAQPYDHTADLWSVGFILYEMYMGKPPFASKNLIELTHNIVNSPVPWPPGVDALFKVFVAGLLRKNPRERLGWPDVAEHPFLMADNSDPCPSPLHPSAADDSLDDDANGMHPYEAGTHGNDNPLHEQVSALPSRSRPVPQNQNQNQNQHPPHEPASGMSASASDDRRTDTAATHDSSSTVTSSDGGLRGQPRRIGFQSSEGSDSTLSSERRHMGSSTPRAGTGTTNASSSPLSSQPDASRDTTPMSHPATSSSSPLRNAQPAAATPQHHHAPSASSLPTSSPRRPSSSRGVVSHTAGHRVESERLPDPSLSSVSSWARQSRSRSGGGGIGTGRRTGDDNEEGGRGSGGGPRMGSARTEGDPTTPLVPLTPHTTQRLEDELPELVDATDFAVVSAAQAVRFVCEQRKDVLRLVETTVQGAANARDLAMVDWPLLRLVLQLAVNVLFCEDRSPLRDIPFLDGIAVVDAVGTILQRSDEARGTLAAGAGVTGDAIVLCVNTLHAAVANEGSHGLGAVIALRAARRGLPVLPMLLASGHIPVEIAALEFFEALFRRLGAYAVEYDAVVALVTPELFESVARHVPAALGAGMGPGEGTPNLGTAAVLALAAAVHLTGTVEPLFPVDRFLL